MLFLFLTHALAGEAISKATVGYPPGGTGDPSCTAHLVVDKAGLAKHVLVTGCPAEFAEECRNELSHWRWEPDGTVFIETRTVRFAQNAPWANVGPAQSVETAVDLLIIDRHHSELVPAERIPPKFPTAASGQNGKCAASVVVPVEGGPPAWVGVEGCEEVFHLASRMALYAWEFAPLAEPGDARWVRSKIALVFNEPAPPEPLDPAGYADLLELTESPKPTFPMGGKKYSPATCRAEFTVDERGRPGTVEVSDCEPLFHIATQNAVQRWAYTHLGEPREVRVLEELEFLSKKDQRKRR